VASEVSTAREEHGVPRGAGTVGVVTWAGSGPPLVLTHGAGLCASFFEPAVPLLRDEWQVIAVDLRGHGNSDPSDTDDGYGLPAHAADLIAVLDHLGHDEACVFGHSFGGAAAMRALLDQPERFDAVAVFEPALGHPDDDPATVRARSKHFAQAIRGRSRRWPDRTALRQDLRAIASYRELARPFLDALVEHGSVEGSDGWRMRCSPETEAELFEVTLSELGGYGMQGDLPELARYGEQFTLLCGDGSGFRLGLYRRIAELAQLPLTVVDGHHFAPFRSPERFAQLVRDHVQGRSSPFRSGRRAYQGEE
jgi:pimeloyl-ACP methyl ester carboxylesterase